MANPQPTDAHLRIAHSISEAIMLRDFTKRQRKILDLILRLSWGCGKREAYIPHQRDFAVVGIYETDIRQELAWLEASCIVERPVDGFYQFNKDFDQWKVSWVKPYLPEKLSELLSLNLNGSAPKLSELLSSDNENLVKHEVKTKQNTKFLTPNLASPKERLSKDIYIDNTIYDKDNGTEKLSKTLSSGGLVFGQSIGLAVEVARGQKSSCKFIKEAYQRELDRRNIDWRIPTVEKAEVKSE